MKKPKFLDLDTEERVKYTIKLNEILLDKYRELANLTDKSINETIESVLEDYIRPKAMYNTYLDNFSSFYITIPYNLLVKDFITKGTYDDIYDLKELNKQSDFNNLIKLVEELYDGEIAAVEEEARAYGIDLDGIGKGDIYYEYYNPGLDTFKIYKVFRVPNNLDKWNAASKTYSSYYNFYDDTSHAGLEFVIIPGIANYTNDYTNCLYCFYMELHNKDLTMVSIEYLEALELIEEAGNGYLLSLLNTIYTALEEAEDIDDVTNLAELYNTGNVRSSSSIKNEKAQPTKLLTGRNNGVTVSYHDKQLLKKIELLEKENKQLKEDLDTVEARTVEKIEDTIKTVLDKYGIDLDDV